MHIPSIKKNVLSAFRWRVGGHIYLYPRICPIGTSSNRIGNEHAKHHYSVADIPAQEKALASYETVFVNTRLNPLKAFINLFGKGSYNVERFISDAFAKRLIAYLQQYDFDIIEFRKFLFSALLPHY